MGKRALIAVVLAVLSLSASGQQRANVGETTKQSAALPPSLVGRAVDLPAEPAVNPSHSTPATLRDAAKANDYDSFESLYQRALQTREPLGAFADLHEIWTHAQNDPAGSFFGADVYSRLCSRYPDFPAFIRDYRVTDRNGQPLYPSRETRAFLLAKAIADVDPIVAPSRPQPKHVEPAGKSPANAGSRNAQPSTTLASETVGTRTVEARGTTAGTSTAPTVPRSNAAIPPREPQKVAEATVVASDTARGIFLIILAMIAIGFLRMTMQASSGGIHAIDEDAGHEPARDPKGAESHT